MPLRDQLLARPDRGRAARHARGAARELDAGQQDAAPDRRGDDRHAPRRADAEVRGAHVPDAGRASTQRPAATRRVAYFHGCGANYYEPRLAEMTVALLEHNGYAVEVPKQDCCGLPAQSNGLFDDARGYVHRLVGEARPVRARRASTSSATSTSCCLMLKREAREILGMEDDPDLRLVSARIFDICEYLLALHERGELKTDFAPIRETVTYHAPCQQRGHGIGKPAHRPDRPDPGADRVIEMRRHLLRRGRDVRAQEGEVPHRDEGRVGAVRPDRRRPAGPQRVRLRDVPLADRARDGRSQRAPGGAAPPRRRPP